MSFETEVQQAVYNALVADVSGLMPLVVGVYDSVLQPADSGDDANYPYVVIGEDTHNDWSTDTDSGDDATITIHVWSRYRGKAEVKEIQGFIYNVLHRANLSVTGYNFVGIDWVNSDSFVDADGYTRHGVQAFRLLLDEV